MQGKVSFISRASDPSTRTFRIEIDVQNTDLSIRDGQTAEIVIASEGVDAHLLPQSALTLNDEGALGVPKRPMSSCWVRNTSPQASP